MVRQDGNSLKSYLSANQFLSPTYRRWYYFLIKDSFADQLSDFDNKFQTLPIHPHYIFIKKSYVRRAKRGIKFVLKSPNNFFLKENTIVSNSEQLLNFLRKENFSSFDDYFYSLPPITTGNLFLGKGSSPRLLFAGKENFVVVKVASGEYVKNYLKIRTILKSYAKELKSKVAVINKIGFAKTKKGCYFLSQFKGIDLETEMTEYHRDSRDDILNICLLLEKIFKKERVFFRNLAPRNIIRDRSGKLYLIDFDHLLEVNTQNMAKICEEALFKKVWFNDVLDRESISSLVSQFTHKGETAGPVVADSFERKFFGKRTISYSERVRLFGLTDLLERYDQYQNMNIYGHQLGRYLSDFWKEFSEVSLLRFVEKNSSKVAKVRTVLYLLSRLDQELLFRQWYGFNLELKQLSESYFLEVSQGRKIINPLKIFHIKGAQDFKSRYRQIYQIIKV